MGLIANLPVGLAPGLGLDAYVRRAHADRLKITLLMYNSGEQLTYSIVGFHGSGPITYQEAMGAVFLEG